MKGIYEHVVGFVTFLLGAALFLIVISRFIHKPTDISEDALAVAERLRSSLTSRFEVEFNLKTKISKDERYEYMIYYEKLLPPFDIESDDWPIIMFYTGEPDPEMVADEVRSAFPDARNVSINYWISSRPIIISNIIASNHIFDAIGDSLVVRVPDRVLSRQAMYFMCGPHSICYRQMNTIKRLDIPEAEMIPVIMKYEPYIYGTYPDGSAAAERHATYLDFGVSPCGDSVKFYQSVCKCSPLEIPVFRYDGSLMTEEGRTVICAGGDKYVPCIVAESPCHEGTYAYIKEGKVVDVYGQKVVVRDKSVIFDTYRVVG